MYKQLSRNTSRSHSHSHKIGLIDLRYLIAFLAAPVTLYKMLKRCLFILVFKFKSLRHPEIFS